jgi:AcrR family transcriptional regulator
MGSVDRKNRQKEKLRNDILETAICILKEDGAQALSLRRIADRIEYTPPMIYTQFRNKEAILIELCVYGYQELNRYISMHCSTALSSEEKIERWFDGYLSFAANHKALYQLMYEQGIISINVTLDFPPLVALLNGLKSLIREVSPEGNNISDFDFQCKAYGALALIHGLISADWFWKINPELCTAVKLRMIKSLHLS